mmetsp:Transcript_1830/g.3443  ORF Transcript_1830/g.3443 Transcript_1830/m.3443 type:complete len:288 (+) Transcript_1830:956-1819(+)
MSQNTSVEPQVFWMVVSHNADTEHALRIPPLFWLELPHQHRVSIWNPLLLLLPGNDLEACRLVQPIVVRFSAEDVQPRVSVYLELGWVDGKVVFDKDYTTWLQSCGRLSQHADQLIVGNVQRRVLQADQIISVGIDRGVLDGGLDVLAVQIPGAEPPFGLPQEVGPGIHQVHRVHVVQQHPLRDATHAGTQVKPSPRPPLAPRKGGLQKRIALSQIHRCDLRVVDVRLPFIPVLHVLVFPVLDRSVRVPQIGKGMIVLSGVGVSAHKGEQHVGVLGIGDVMDLIRPR